jgi:hypothetical protein
MTEESEIDKVLNQHLRPGQRVHATMLGDGTIIGKHTRGLTEVISYTIKLDHPVDGDPYIDAAPDRVQALP